MTDSRPDRAPAALYDVEAQPPLWRPAADERERPAQIPERHASHAAAGTRPAATAG